MAKQSSGILAYRIVNNLPEVLLVHPGGPYFARKDAGAWSIPKGEFEDEEPLQAAVREFEEELGFVIKGNFIELIPIAQKGGKKVYAWAIETDCDTANFKSNTFSIEWPPRSGKMKEFPEVDKAEWMRPDKAKQMINVNQAALIDELMNMLVK